MKKKPLVSVLLPVHNGGDGLQAAVQSILAQTESRFELIVIDDGSDRPVEQGRSPGFSDARLRIHRQSRSGIVAALNLGLAMARGTYIARMDADDTCERDRLEKQLAMMEQEKDWGAVSCLVRHGRCQKNDEGFRLFVAWVNSLVSVEGISCNRFIESPVVHPTLFWRRELVDSLGGYREFDGPEDYELWLRWLESGVKIGKVLEPLYTWNDGATRLTRTDPRYRPDAFHRCKAPYLARWLAAHNPYHPDILVWGAGRVTRRRVDLLEPFGVRVTGFVDIDPNKIGQDLPQGPVLHPDDIPPAGSRFVLSCVGSRGARSLIARLLEEKGYRCARDYILAA